MSPFEFVFVLYSLVLGLSLVELLTGLGRTLEFMLARERALSIERTELHLAHQEGRAEGEAIGQARGREEGRAAAIREVLDALAEGNITEVELRKKFGIDPS